MQIQEAGLTSFFQLTTEFLMIPCGATEGPSVSGMASTSWAAEKARRKTSQQRYNFTDDVSIAEA